MCLAGGKPSIVRYLAEHWEGAPPFVQRGKLIEPVGAKTTANESSNDPTDDRAQDVDSSLPSPGSTMRPEVLDALDDDTDEQKEEEAHSGGAKRPKIGRAKQVPTGGEELAKTGRPEDVAQLLQDNSNQVPAFQMLAKLCERKQMQKSASAMLSPRAGAKLKAHGADATPGDPFGPLETAQQDEEEPRAGSQRPRVVGAAPSTGHKARRSKERNTTGRAHRRRHAAGPRGRLFYHEANARTPLDEFHAWRDDRRRGIALRSIDILTGFPPLLRGRLLPIFKTVPNFQATAFEQAATQAQADSR
eukprot:g13170.t1